MKWVVTPHPGRTLPPEKTHYPLYRRLGGPQRRSGQVRIISPPPEFDPRTLQRYTDCAVPAHRHRRGVILKHTLIPQCFFFYKSFQNRAYAFFELRSSNYETPYIAIYCSLPSLPSAYAQISYSAPCFRTSSTVIRPLMLRIQFHTHMKQTEL